MRLEPQLDALALEDWQQLLERAPEMRLALRLLLGPSVELAVHDLHAELDCDFDRALPVAHGSLALVLARPRPAIERQYGRDLDSGGVEGLAEVRDRLAVGARVDEEGDEVRPRRELDVLVSELGDHTRKLEQWHVAEHVGVESDLHLGVLLRRRWGSACARSGARGPWHPGASGW
jgi:hypothetical protein